jgi:hypothetical protein
MHPMLVALVWLVGAGLVMAVVAFVILKWIALRIATLVAVASERRLAATLGEGMARAGLGTTVVAPDESQRRTYLAQIDRLAWVMDRVVPLPIIGGIGLDAVLGLVPVVGDVASLGISSVIIIRASQLGVPPELVSRMVAIHCTDLALGAVPVLGDLVDAGYQANRRSAELVRAWISATPRAGGSNN